MGTTGSDDENTAEAAKDPTTTRASMMTVRVALCQFHVTKSKAANLQTCTRYLDSAAAAGADVAVLPEIWNAPYATAAFAEYAEDLSVYNADDDDDGSGTVNAKTMMKKGRSPSTDLLRSKVIQHGLWIVGGSIPEIEKISNGGSNKIYNTCQVFDPSGAVIAKHRKVHLFNMAVPGGITFRESDTLSPGSAITSFKTPWGTLGWGSATTSASRSTPWCWHGSTTARS
jgi:omega-amidase